MLRVHCLLIAGCVFVTSCDTVPSQTAALTLSDEGLAQRQIQGRRFDTTDEAGMLRASAGVLQDLGFTIDETSTSLGMLSGSKERGAVEVRQVAVAFAAALFGVATPIENTQKIKVSVVVTPTADRSGMIVRTTFQRIIWNTQHQVSRMIPVKDAAVYQQFYDKLSQSVFLQGHDL